MSLDPPSLAEGRTMRLKLFTFGELGRAAVAWQIFGPVLVMIIVYLLDVLTMRKFISPLCTIYPRTLFGLPGIVTTPFVHESLGHLTTNIYGWVGLSAAVSTFGSRQFWRTTVILVLGQGLLVWTFARPAHHAGCSGILFGYSGFLISVCFWERPIHCRSLVVLALVLLTYGARFLSVGMSVAGVSWEGHLFGFIAGIAAGYECIVSKADSKLSDGGRYTPFLALG